MIAFKHIDEKTKGELILIFGSDFIILHTPVVDTKYTLTHFVIALNITQLMFIVCLAATFGAVGTLLVTRSDVKIISALSLIIIAACLLPPLLFFTLYFCAIHAVYHTRLVQKRNKMTMQELYQTSLFPMVATLVIFVLAYLFLQQINTQNSWTALIFIGLFAVTIPHIIIEFNVSKRLSKFTH